MNEQQSSEVEKLLLYIGDARGRARQAADRVEKDGGEPHVVAALRDSEQQLDRLHRDLAQRTYYAVARSDLKLAV